jgi:catechol 2,3-dioxygenase-like lactoylglutathione lyase family enzyme
MKEDDVRKRAFAIHVSIGVRDIARTKRFYDAALKPLGHKCLSEGEGSLGYGRDAVTLWMSSTDRPVPADLKSGLHFCFARPRRAALRHSTRRH